MNKYISLILVTLMLSACAPSATNTVKVDYRAALNPETRTMSLSGKDIGEITSLTEVLPDRDEQLRVNHFVANDAGITRVDPNAFLFLQNLSELNLANNRLTEFALAPSNSLVDIKLAHNLLTRVDLSEQPLGHNVDLSFNKISNLGDVLLPKDVLELNLANNSITDVSALQNYKLLRILDLSNNPLDSEDLESLKNLPRLAVVTLEGSVPAEEAKKLQEWLDDRQIQGTKY